MEQPLADVGLTATLILEFKEGKRCAFWFLRADKLRAHKGTTLPKLQTLRKEHPDWLVQRTISFVEGCTGAYKADTLVVSHCWEEPSEPDRMGVQFETIKKHLAANHTIKWVWYDYWSMPQGRLEENEKTEWEDAEFTVMLPNINLVYLFCSVLVLQDRQYMSRFWTQFEAFLSMRKVTTNGLDFVKETERRVIIAPIHNAPNALTVALVEEWGNKTAKEAHDVLKQPDVKITNLKDKDIMLPKLLKLDDFAKQMVAENVVPALPIMLSSLTQQKVKSSQVMPEPQQ